MTRSELLFYELARLRRDYVRGRTWRCAVGVVAVLLGAFTLAALADVLLRLHSAWCWLVWLGLLAVVGAGAWLVRRTARTPVSNEALAVLVENVVGGAGNHVINAVQFASNQALPGSFVEAVLSESDPGMERLQSRQLYSQKPYKRFQGVLAGAAAVLLIAFAVTPRRMGAAALRMLAPMAGIRPYTLTQIASVEPGDTVIPRGQTIAVAAALRGDTPERAVIVWERAADKADTLPLQAGEAGRYQGELKGVFHDSRYRVLAGDARSVWYTIRVTNPPGLEHWEARVTPPEYLGRKTYTLDGTATEAGVPVGSSVVLGGSASAPLSTAVVLQDEVTLVEKSLSGGRKFALTFTMREGSSVRLRLVGENGLESTSVMPFAVLPDQKPTVVLVDTKQRVVAAADAQVPVVFKADDDNGVTRVGLERLLSEERSEPVSDAQPEGGVKSFAGRFLLDVASFDARAGDTLRFRVWAEDNGADRVARRGYSPVLQLTVPAS